MVSAAADADGDGDAAAALQLRADGRETLGAFLGRVEATLGGTAAGNIRLRRARAART